ncbi:MAG: aminopeptidase P family protein [Clostridiales bacterium]|jgi:Xaa-Pro aminopeptidase|nr:aminopeptidase P family protein [Clostridiales bacterium]
MKNPKNLFLTGGFDAVLITGGVNKFYFTDFESEDSLLLLLPGRAFFLVDKRYAEAARAAVSAGSPAAFAGSENTENYPCGIIDITAADPFEAAGEILRSERVGKLGFEDAFVSYSDFLKMRKMPADLIPVSEKLYAMRKIKSPSEILRIEKAAEITEKTMAHVLNSLKEGVTEKDLADEINAYMRKNGAENVSFEPIVAFDANTARPHHAYGNAKLKNGSVVTVDLGAKFKGYCADMTRSFVFGGKNTADSEYVVIYDAVFNAQRAALDFIAAESAENSRFAKNSAVKKFNGRSDAETLAGYGGVSGKDADSVARNIIIERGYGSFFTHALGHAVGLEIHEQPRLSQKSGEKLLPGNVVTVEPGIYLERRFGVRIEDMILLTADGVRNFYTAQKNLTYI